MYEGVGVILIGAVGIIAFLARQSDDNNIKGLLSVSSFFGLIGAVNVARVIAIDRGATTNLVNSIWAVELFVMLLTMFIIFYTAYRLIHSYLVKLGKVKDNG